VSFDGIDEETNIRGRLEDLAGGRILDQEPDEEQIPVDTQGKVRPYIVLSMGAPFANPGSGRSMGDGEEDIPYTMTFVVGCYAGDRDSLNSLYKAVVKRLVGWTPSSVDNATPIRLPYAYNGATRPTTTKPSIVSKIAAMACTINLSTE
jgi:hypothetical protein